MSKVSFYFAKAVVGTVRKVTSVYEKVNVHYLRGAFKHLGRNICIEFPATVMNPQRISIGDHFTARPGLKLRAYTSFAGVEHNPSIFIGNGVHLAADCTISATYRIEIHDNAALGAGSKVMDHMHGLPGFEDLQTLIMDRILTSKGGVIIRENVMLGAGVVILPGVEIGKNSVVGANSVVTKSIPANSIAAGVPAKVLKTIEFPQ